MIGSLRQCSFIPVIFASNAKRRTVELYFNCLPHPSKLRKIFQNVKQTIRRLWPCPYSYLINIINVFFFAECPILPASISNGNVHGSGNVEGSSYRFSCQVGYALVGSEMLYCTQEGRWNASIPTCLRGERSIAFRFLILKRKTKKNLLKGVVSTIFSTKKGMTISMEV